MIWYDVGEALCRLVLRLIYRFRIEGEELVPPCGPALFVSNHQSFLDPVLNGCAVVDRQLTAIARASLFRSRFFSWLMHSYGAIRIKDDGGDAAAMKAALSELAAGRCVLVYPEGTRSPDGRIQPFKRGVALLLKRAGAPVVPMAIEGASDVWPPHRRRPALRGRLGVKVGTPIPSEELLKDGPDAALERLRTEIEALRLQIRATMHRQSSGRWPRAGGD